MKLNSAPGVFGLKFLLIFAVLAGGFEAARGTQLEQLAVEDLILEPTTAFINIVAGSDPTQLQGRTLVSATAQLHVTRGCEGIEMFLLLAAAMLAYPASGARRARGMLIGFGLAFVLSVLRLAALDFTLRYVPAAWESLHGLVLPLAPVMMIALYFAGWAQAARSEEPVARQADPHAA